MTPEQEQLQLATAIPDDAGDELGLPGATLEQRRAVEARDRDVLLDAGAGTGKTRVLVERYCDALTEDGLGIEAIVAFTFTERAAAELRSRIRSELEARAAAAAGDANRAAELRALARDSDAAWISTIHGFCRRLLASHPIALGLDPRFRVLDEAESDRVALRAFDDALEELLSGGAPERARLVAAIGRRELRSMVQTAYDELRIQGSPDPALPPRPAPRSEAAALAELADAAGAALAEVSEGRGGDANLERLRRAASIEPGSNPPSTELEELELTGGARAFSGEACERYRAAWRAARRIAVERESAGLYEHLSELVGLFGARFAALKDERSGLDFTDLEIEAARLLRDHPRIAEAYRERLRHVMVDEFQDTNRLQVELIELLRGAETRLFAVGDEFQSIYGFRHADLRVFRGERERIAELPDERAETMRLSGNFRARPRLIAAVNALGDALLDGYRPLTIGVEPETAPAAGPEVELLLTPGGRAWRDEALGIRLAGDHPSTHDRVAEARFLAARLRALVDGGVDRGEIVVLLRAFTHVRAFEEELELAGLRPYVVGGRGYWSQQQVEDVRRLLAAIANPLDDLALLGALGSPACGVRPDTLWLLRDAARRDEVPGGHLWPALERRFGEGVDSPEGEEPAPPADDAARLARFCTRLAALRDDGPRLGLEDLVERAVAATGYDLAVLRMREGASRYANVRKLMRLAREYEAAEGRDLRGFVDHLSDRAGREDPEGEAATEAEEHEGVRIMTVHAAKGLEFPVVAVADLGRRLLVGSRPRAVRIDAAGHDDASPDNDGGEEDVRVGIRLARFGARAIGLYDYDELLAEAEIAESAEARRLAYVAATRARDHLLLSGTYGSSALAKDEVPGTPITERLVGALELSEGEDAAVELPAAVARPDLELASTPGEIEVRFNLPDPEAFRRLAPDVTATELAPGVSDRPAAMSSAVAGEPAHRLSYSALASFGTCGYRFYAERVLRLPGTPGADERGDTEAPRSQRYGFGSAVHAMLEWSARHRWREPPEKVCAELLRAEGLPGDGGELARVREMIAAWLECGLRAELDPGTVSLRPEMPFLLPLGGSIVRGNIDLLAETPDGPIVVDYKTDSLADADPEDLVERYGVQRAIYALAAGGDDHGGVRTAYAFLDGGGEVLMRDFDAAELDAARAELERLVADVRAGRFKVTERPHAALCWDCPARARLCSHPREATGRRL